MKHLKNNGSAVLALLIAVAIIMMLYVLQMGTLFGPVNTHPPKGIENHPWVLEDLLVPENEKVKRPRRPKPALNDPLTVDAAVKLDEADRGQATLTFEPNGRIHSRWECRYEQTGITYRIDAEMKGNIVPKRTYTDENGKDKSRLFFIAKGPYTKTPVQGNIDADETADLGEKGTCWLTGWLGPDLHPAGHLTITTDQQWAGVYTLSTTEQNNAKSTP